MGAFRAFRQRFGLVSPVELVEGESELDGWDFSRFWRSWRRGFGFGDLLCFSSAIGSFLIFGKLALDGFSGVGGLALAFLPLEAKELNARYFYGAYPLLLAAIFGFLR